MSVTVRSNLVSRSIMVLCLGTAALLLITQGRTSTIKPEKFQTTSEIHSAGTLDKPAGQTASAQERLAHVAPKGAKLVVDLSDRQVHLYNHANVIATYPLAVGQVGWETPTGEFRVNQMQQNPAWSHPITQEIIPAGAENNPLGQRWIGFSSQDRMDIGFHGTNDTELLGQAVSHGCLRMRNEDIVALYKQIGIGTPIIVQP